MKVACILLILSQLVTSTARCFFVERLLMLTLMFVILRWLYCLSFNVGSSISIQSTMCAMCPEETSCPERSQIQTFPLERDCNAIGAVILPDSTIRWNALLPAVPALLPPSTGPCRNAQQCKFRKHWQILNRSATQAVPRNAAQSHHQHQRQ